MLFTGRVGNTPAYVNGEILVAGNSTAAVGGTGLAVPCNDSLAGVGVALSFTRVSGGRVGLVLPPLDLRQQAISKNLSIGGTDPFDMRCTGPRLIDVVRPAMTPIGAMPLSAYRRRHLQLDLPASDDAPKQESWIGLPEFQWRSKGAR
jgi:hypothetical protein